MTDDAVTTLGAGVDGAVRRLSYTYDVRGDLSYITSADAAVGGSVVNQVKREYTSLGCLTADFQNHYGPVNSGTPSVQYQCTNAVSGILRRTQIIYPNSRAIAYGYGSSRSIDDVLCFAFPGACTYRLN